MEKKKKSLDKLKVLQLKLIFNNFMLSPYYGGEL